MQDHIIVDIEVTARVSIDRSEMIDHVKDCRDTNQLIEEGRLSENVLECECHKDGVTENDVAQCMAFNMYLEDKNAIDFSWNTCTTNAPDLPLEVYEEEDE